MRGLSLRLFQLAVRILPRDFRLTHGAEIEGVFAERMREQSRLGVALFVLDEIRDIGIVAARVRIERISLSRRTYAAAVLTAMVLTAVPLCHIAFARGAGRNLPSRIDFSANDPAGQFTLTMLDGRPGIVTMNEVPLSPERVIHNGDSIHVLASSGKVVLALAYYRETGRIEWKPRPAACQSHPEECDAYQ